MAASRLVSRILIIVGIFFYITVNFIFLWSCQQPTTDCSKSCFDRPSVLTSEPLKHVTKSQSPGVVRNRAGNITTNNHVAPNTNGTDQWGYHRLAVVVPFRDRWEELLQFVPHIHQFLNRQKVSHSIWVINQADTHRFNRAMLINVGFTLSRALSDYFVMHDVDLLPMNDDLSYSYPSNGPLHIASPELHPLYHYKKFVGGIMMMTKEDFEKINGLTNIFWGWGREDDEFYLRMMEANLKLNRPQNIKTGYKTFKHLHDKEKRPRDMASIGSQRTISRQRDRGTGLNNLQYELLNTVNMTIAGATITFVNVKLHCDYITTPFCDHKS